MPNCGCLEGLARRLRQDRLARCQRAPLAGEYAVVEKQPTVVKYEGVEKNVSIRKHMSIPKNRGNVAAFDYVAHLGGVVVPRRKLTMDEVAQHSAANSCWIVLHGHVFDVTDWMDHHPGGGSLLLGNAGKDATKAFEMVGHPWDVIRKHLPGKVVGTLAQADDKDVKDALRGG